LTFECNTSAIGRPVRPAAAVKRQPRQGREQAASASAPPSQISAANQIGMEVLGEQKTKSASLTGEQAGEQIGEQADSLRLGAGRRGHSGFRLVSRGAAGVVGADQTHSWPVVRNLALVPALTGAQAPARAGDSDATRQPELAQANNLLTSEQTDWIKSLLPKLAEGATGWWEVEARGKGFGIKFRWRARGQHTLTFARVSRAAYQRLVKMRGQTVQIGGKTYVKAEW